MSDRIESDDHDIVQYRLGNYTATYYSVSGGVVVRKGGKVVDAGLVFEPGGVEKAVLASWLRRWMIRTSESRW